MFHKQESLRQINSFAVVGLFVVRETKLFSDTWLAYAWSMLPYQAGRRNLCSTYTITPNHTHMHQTICIHRNYNNS